MMPLSLHVEIFCSSHLEARTLYKEHTLCVTPYTQTSLKRRNNLELTMILNMKMLMMKMWCILCSCIFYGSW